MSSLAISCLFKRFYVFLSNAISFQAISCLLKKFNSEGKFLCLFQKCNFFSRDFMSFQAVYAFSSNVMSSQSISCLLAISCILKHFHVCSSDFMSAHIISSLHKQFHVLTSNVMSSQAISFMSSQVI
jgi:hypothetical protein